LILRALIYALGVFFLTGVIALVVAGIIKLIYMAVHRGEVKKKEAEKVDAKPATD
jgi:hypothetical protein